MPKLIVKSALFGLVILLLLPVLAIAGCSQPATAKVRIGYLLGDIHHLPFFVAVEKGLYKAEGVDVEIVGPFDAGPAEMDAMAAGQLDMGYVGVPPVILAAARKVPVTVVAGVNLEGSALAAANSITTVAGLKSKKIATPAPGSIQYVLTGMMLAKNNMTVKDVELFPGTIKAPDMPLTLQTGNIDAYFIWEPFVAKSVVSGTGHVLVDSKEIWPGHPCCVVVTRNEFLKNNDKAVAAVIRAHEKAIKFIADNPAESKTIAQKYTKLDSAIIDSAFNRVKYVSTVNSDDLKRFVKEIIALGEGGSIKPIIATADVPDVDAFIKNIIDLKYLSR
jgi:NitT/TauT family transport system substrate-binding protein